MCSYYFHIWANSAIILRPISICMVGRLFFGKLSYKSVDQTFAFSMVDQWLFLGKLN